MTEISLLECLEEIALKMGVELRYENFAMNEIRTEGGFCKLLGKPMILIDRKDSKRRKILILAKSLGKLNLEGIFIPPAVRRVIENQTN